MLLRRLSLRNVRSYEELDLAFEEGITLLSGDIGSGKSSVLQAIEFSLFGTQRAALDGESLLRHGADEGIVTLTFSIGATEYTASRTLKRGAQGVRQTDCSLSTDGATESLSAQELKARVLTILGYPDALLTKSKGLIFRHTIYTPQEEMKQIIFLPIEERLNTLRALFGIERYKLVKENANLVLRELRAQERADLLVSSAAPQLEREAGIASDNAIAALTNVEAAKSVLATTAIALMHARASLSEKRIEYELLLGKEQERAALSNRLRELDRAQRNAREDLGRIEEYFAVPIEPVEDANAALDVTRREQLTIERELHALAGRTAELSAKRNIHSDQARSIITLATCPVCRQGVTEGHKHAVQTDTDAAVRDFEVALDSLRSRERDLRATHQAAVQRFTGLSEQQRRYSVYQRDLLARAEQERQRLRLEERLATLIQDISVASERLATFVPPNPVVQESYRAAEQIALAREHERDVAGQALGVAQSLESSARSQAAVLIERLGNAQAAAARVAKTQAQRQWLEEHFLETVTIVERHVLASLHAEFGELFSSFFMRLVEDDSLAVGLGESFEPVIVQNGYDSTLEQLSGGEKTAVALSYRLGLYKVVSDFVSTIKTKDLLILDEPTDGFSTEQLHRVRDVLRELGCRQILLVSHEPHMENACDQVIRIAKRMHRSTASLSA